MPQIQIIVYSYSRN